MTPPCPPPDGYEYTGEYRIARPGEWFLCIYYGKIALQQDVNRFRLLRYMGRRHILRVARTRKDGEL